MTGFAYGTVTLCGHGFHRVPLPFSSTCWRSYNPGRALPLCRFRLLRVRSPLLAESLLFSFPAGNEMFQFPAFASFTDTGLCRWVAPFGYPRINGYLPLPAAFRSLSRPSSPPRATGIPRAPLFAFLFIFRLFEYDLQSLLFWPAPPCPCGLGVQAGSIALEFS